MDRYETVGALPDCLIIRFESQIYFANADYLRTELYRYVEDNPEAKYIIIDSSTISDIDSTGLHLLDNIDKDFSERGIELHLCGTIGVVRDALHLSVSSHGF